MATSAQIVYNQLGGDVLLLFTANASVNCTGNSTSGSSDLAVSSAAAENVQSLTVKSVLAGTPGGNGSFWTLSRGSTLIGVYSDGNYDYFQHGMVMSANSGVQTLVANLWNSTNGSLTVLVKKTSIYTSDYIVH